MRTLHGLTLIAWAAAVVAASPVRAQTPVPLRAGSAIPDREPGPGLPHAFTLDIAANDFVYSVADQNSVVVVEEGALVARHRRHGDLPLRPLERDVFPSPTWFFSNVRFERAADGRVTGMRVSNGRVRNLWLERLP